MAIETKEQRTSLFGRNLLPFPVGGFTKGARYHLASLYALFAGQDIYERIELSGVAVSNINLSGVVVSSINMTGSAKSSINLTGIVRDI